MRNAYLILLALLFLLPVMAMAQNTPPVVDAGEDQTIFLGEATVLYGTATDVDGQPIAYWLWAVESAPTGSVPEILYPYMYNPVFTTDVAGDYVLSLVASDGMDWSEPDFVTIHVHEILPPEAVIDADLTSGPAPLTVQFDGSASFVDPYAGPLTYDWSFGDGGTSVAVAPSHTYDLPGNYHVTLIVIDEQGQSDEDFIDITVTAPNNPPTASPTATPNTGPTPLVVLFAANASDPDGDPLTYLWDFGDPTSPTNSSTLADPGHVYEAPGTYVAWLTVSDGQEEISASVTVTVSPTATLSTVEAEVTPLLRWEDKGNISLTAEFDLPAPAPDDVISLSFDGIELFANSFGEFKRSRNSNVYLLLERRLLVSIDLDAQRIYVRRGRVSLDELDNSNGIDVELNWGDIVAVDQFTMTPVGNGRLIYHRDE